MHYFCRPALVQLGVNKATIAEQQNIYIINFLPFYFYGAFKGRKWFRPQPLDFLLPRSGTSYQ
jgi:hypothetical protein